MQHAYGGPESKQGSQAWAARQTGENRTRDNKDYIQFHYDVSNEFYQLFLDPEMQYSCGYFQSWTDTLEQAQLNKLDMICRKLRLRKDDRFLDIGCGWGGLICHAATHYGVRAHGITLSRKQHDFAKQKIDDLGLEDRVTVEIRDYRTLAGSYDKVASIGMFEHIGVENFPAYFRKVQSLMRDRGLFLNHGIARRSRSKRRKAGHITTEKRILHKYIFPGTELAPVGFTLNSLEERGFEIHDVEAWREHYALTCRNWCLRLSGNREQAISLVGTERYNLWVAYLASVSFGFAAGNMLIFQVLASKRGREKGLSGMPPTRKDLYTESRTGTAPVAMD
jgi:cyclopropane-fatty-acyl-phospholipid synthase